MTDNQTYVNMKQRALTAEAECERLMAALTHISKTIERQIDLIAERAPGKFLDKTPIVRSLMAHKQNCDKALGETK